MYESLRFQGGVGGVIPAKAGIQLFQYVIKALDPGVRPRIQTLRGGLGGAGKRQFFHTFCPGPMYAPVGGSSTRRLSWKFPPAGKQITLLKA